MLEVTGDTAGRKGNDRGLDQVQRKPEVKRGVSRPKGGTRGSLGDCGKCKRKLGSEGESLGALRKGRKRALLAPD